MNDRKAFEHYLRSKMLCDNEDLTWQPKRNCYKEFHVHFAWQTWKACAEHYEAVMRRVLVEIYDQNIEAYRGLGGPMACETYMDEVIKRAREEG